VYVLLPYQMLRNLAPREMTADQQREADEQLGQIAAAVARSGRRVTAQVHAVSALAARDGHQRPAFRKSGPARRRAAHRA
jgi:hypothetical protein